MSKSQEDVVIELPTKDYSDRFPLDQLLRKHGFQILSRPNKGETMWEKQGKKFTQKKALYTISREERKKAEGAA